MKNKLCKSSCLSYCTVPRAKFDVALYKSNAVSTSSCFSYYTVSKAKFHLALYKSEAWCL